MRGRGSLDVSPHSFNASGSFSVVAEPLSRLLLPMDKPCFQNLPLDSPCHGSSTNWTVSATSSRNTTFSLSLHSWGVTVSACCCWALKGAPPHTWFALISFSTTCNQFSRMTLQFQMPRVISDFLTEYWLTNQFSIRNVVFFYFMIKD